VVDIAIREPLSGFADQERFETVVKHLMTNADKFGPPGSVIRVHGFVEDEKVHVTVSDEGPGIPHEEREAVFQRFYQIDGSVTRHHGGIGLGLFLSRLLMRAMNGDLVIDDVPSGTRLHATLPTDNHKPVAVVEPGQRGGA
jgi:signal transduction histidine kinase